MNLNRRQWQATVLDLRAQASSSIFNLGKKMSRERANAYRAVTPVTIPFSNLEDKDQDLSPEIEEAFGPNGLGLISISHVPGFSLLHQSILHLSPIFASLPDDLKDSFGDPETGYGSGWSYGKNKVEPGKLDAFKGYFNANPILDIPTTDVSLVQRYPTICLPNVWPAALPELEGAFKALGKIVLDIGLMLAYHCDKFVSKGVLINKDHGLEQMIRRSRCHRARLLYYSPWKDSECTENTDSVSSWCGWHTDFSCLTGLTSSMFLRNGVEIACPDRAAGLHIKARNNEIVQVFFGEDELAFQIGKTAEINSGGCLRATPHCVRAPCMEKADGVVRSTFAMFLQPNWDENLKLPPMSGTHPEVLPTNGILTFGEFAEGIVTKNYRGIFA